MHRSSNPSGVENKQLLSHQTGVHTAHLQKTEGKIFAMPIDHYKKLRTLGRK